MTKLSVNINKVATLRNARGGNVPDLIQVALDIERFGAQGITVHPRPDQRHIRYDDVRELKRRISTELNIEGNPTESFMALVEEVRPAQVTLVPDAPDALTSNAGWDVATHFDYLCGIIAQLKAWGCRTSIFVGTDHEQIRLAAQTGTDRIELYTEPYASLYETNSEEALRPFASAIELGHSLGLGINAGHDLNLNNLKSLAQCSAHLSEVSIGHALISDALYLGLERTIAAYLDQLKD